MQVDVNRSCASCALDYGAGAAISPRDAEGGKSNAFLDRFRSLVRLEYTSLLRCNVDPRTTRVITLAVPLFRRAKEEVLLP
jgi:hypothetical protein